MYCSKGRDGAPEVTLAHVPLMKVTASAEVSSVRHVAAPRDLSRSEPLESDARKLSDVMTRFSI